MKKLTTIYMNKALVSFNNINSLTSKNETSKEKKFKTRPFPLISCHCYKRKLNIS